MYIYKTTNLVNGKVYIGQSLKEKFTSKYYGSGILIGYALKKYGLDKFKVDLLCYVFNQLDLDNSETFFVAYYRNKLGKENVYNIANGGNNIYNSSKTRKQKFEEGQIKPWNKGIPRTDEEKRKMSKSKKGKKLDLTKEQHKSEARSGKNNPMYGKKVYDIWLEKYGKEEADRKQLEHNKKNSIRNSGKGNAMFGKSRPKGKDSTRYGKSNYSIWLEKYGKEEADKRKKQHGIRLSIAGKNRYKKEVLF